ncbi:MAG: DNA double-strand break repair nuclease NurA [Promethearchaeota archaeon]
MNIKEELKRIEFNQTEPEVLRKLIQKAQRRGRKTQIQLKSLNTLTGHIINELKTRDFFPDKLKINEQLVEKCAIGIDGSFQLTGGIGGKWYVFLSVARILFHDGIQSKPEVNVFWANIDELDEHEDPRVNLLSEMKMLIGESKALLNWGSKNKRSLIFIDGPIVDPPFYRKEHNNYIDFRCQSIKTTFNKSILIGCVKRIREKFFINYISKNYGINDVEKFPTDQHLMLFLFTKLRTIKTNGSIYTQWIDLGEVDDPAINKYNQKGIFLVSFFYERDIKSKILRIDLALNLSPKDNKDSVDILIRKIVNNLDYWTYPGQDPLPILLAHEKCNIRRGAAEILYEEILTKSRSLDPFNQLVSIRMR